MSVYTQDETKHLILRRVSASGLCASSSRVHAESPRRETLRGNKRFEVLYSLFTFSKNKKGLPVIGKPFFYFILFLVKT